MSEETISEEQVLHIKLSFEINQELIHLMKRIIEIQQENKQLKEKVGELTQSLNEQMKETNKENLDCSKYAIENQQLKDKINTYENPEDLTLMFMYCDEKAKDKIKQLKEVIEEVRECIEREGLYYLDLTNQKIWGERLLKILDKAKGE